MRLGLIKIAEFDDLIISSAIFVFKVLGVK